MKMNWVILGVLGFATTMQAGSDMRLWYRQAATNWEKQALPIGNGRLGGMVFGGVQEEHVQFNVDSLWTGDENPAGMCDMATKPCPSHSRPANRRCLRPPTADIRPPISGLPLKTHPNKATPPAGPGAVATPSPKNPASTDPKSTPPYPYPPAPLRQTAPSKNAEPNAYKTTDAPPAPSHARQQTPQTPSNQRTPSQASSILFYTTLR